MQLDEGMLQLQPEQKLTCQAAGPWTFLKAFARAARALASAAPGPANAPVAGSSDPVRSQRL